MGYYNGGMCLSARQKEMRDRNKAAKLKHLARIRVMSLKARCGEDYLKDCLKMDKKRIKFSSDLQQQRQQYCSLPHHKPSKRYREGKIYHIVK